MSCPNHPNEPKLGYLDACADADRRLKRRETQWLCGLCNRWVWGEFVVASEGGMIAEGWWRKEQKRKERAK